MNKKPKRSLDDRNNESIVDLMYYIMLAPTAAAQEQALHRVCALMNEHIAAGRRKVMAKRPEWVRLKTEAVQWLTAAATRGAR